MSVYWESEHIDGWLILFLHQHFSIFNNRLLLLLIGRLDFRLNFKYGTWKKTSACITFSLHCYPSNVDQFRGGRGGIWAQEEKWRFPEKKSVLPVCVHWRTHLVCAVTVTLWVRPDWDMSGISGCPGQASSKASLHTDGVKGQAAATRGRSGEGEPVTEWSVAPHFFWTI